MPTKMKRSRYLRDQGGRGLTKNHNYVVIIPHSPQNCNSQHHNECDCTDPIGQIFYCMRCDDLAPSLVELVLLEKRSASAIRNAKCAYDVVFSPIKKPSNFSLFLLAEALAGEVEVDE